MGKFQQRLKDIRKSAFERGAAVAFGLTGMAEAIRAMPHLCKRCGWDDHDCACHPFDMAEHDRNRA